MVVLGLSGAPNAGDELLVVESERKAREVAMHRQSKSRDVKLALKSANMQDVFSTMGENKADLVQLLVKADVQGSVEALRDALNALSTGEVVGTLRHEISCHEVTSFPCFVFSAVPCWHPSGRQKHRLGEGHFRWPDRQGSYVGAPRRP